jgi:molybdate transport system regulatory protein
MPDTETITVRYSLRLDFAPGGRLGPGKADLLQAIAETGSISGAGRAMRMSYRRAWLLVDELNRMFSRPVVEAQPGGAHGGGARLTEIGQEVLARYRAIEASGRAAGEADIAALRALLAAAPAADAGPPPG